MLSARVHAIHAPTFVVHALHAVGRTALATFVTLLAPVAFALLILSGLALAMAVAAIL